MALLTTYGIRHAALRPLASDLGASSPVDDSANLLRNVGKSPQLRDANAVCKIKGIGPLLEE